ncbi:uncharacterized protein TRUGW13939_11457 [Talaromyces rugulosus]|uniref:Uncharacterized protein n=1 Tax=Talaromyces rugulosus TaxID=121627 RepID=A0A7H8RD05_TALRU|nr:uncharacterized protein TRUGW13939_11457 [Talaromyces rugulosus]QKX64284.1 hypothetical protein TRUGW13939_11457 [Talaromyces rugulosus]
MASTTTRIRNTLNSLWTKVLDDDKMSGSLGVDGDVLGGFLEKHNIRLVSHDFEITEVEDSHPPVLFAPCPQHFLDEHPIEPEKCDDPKFGNPFYKFPDYEAGGTWMEPEESSLRVARYLEKWAYNGFPRKGTDVVDCLPTKRGITPVRFPHGLLLGEGLLRSGEKGWKTNIYEYDIGFWGEQHPHIILCSQQSEVGHENCIMHGELAQLITAMRNRAHEPEMMESGENGDFEDEEDENEALFPEGSPLVFQYEQRFPVVMVSLVGPQHGRIYYACMDGFDVVIRQSPLFSFEKRETAPWDFFARILLSYPLHEGDKGRLSVPLRV